MSSVDDILFAPIQPLNIESLVLEEMIAKALTDRMENVVFHIDNTMKLDTYIKVAEAINTNNTIFNAARQIVMVNPAAITGVSERPTGSLSAQDVFTRIHSGNPEFFWTAPQSIHGVEHYKFTNIFHIVSGLPMAEISSGGTFEWWILGLMEKFLGYQRYYCFGTETEARNWWSAYP